MMERCFPFPALEAIAQIFPEQAISERTYQVAQDFYVNSLNASDQLKQFIRLSNGKEQEEQKVVDSLIRQAVEIALFYRGTG